MQKKNPALLEPRSNPKLLSFVVPVYNEEEVFPHLRTRLEAVSKTLPCAAEFVLINDGSRDATARLAFEWADQNPAVKVIDFSRNFGHQTAITAGIDYAQGDALLIMDGDLQDPPELANEMLARYRDGYDVVYGKRIRYEGIGFFKKFFSAGFYWFMRTFIADLPSHVGDFRLISRPVASTLQQLREGQRFMRGIVTWIGFPQTFVEFERPGRVAGDTKYPFKKSAKFAWDGILCFTNAPLQLAFFVSGFLVFCSFSLGVAAVLTTGNWRLWTAISASQCLVGAFALLSLGFVGEYVGRLFDESRQRPLYIVRRSANLEGVPQVPRSVLFYSPKDLASVPPRRTA